MEVARKSKSLKKRKHSSKYSRKEDTEKISRENIFEDAEKRVISQEKVKAIRNNINELEKSQFIQTDISCINESKKLLTEKDEQIKNLAEKLQQTTNKLYESKNAYTALKQEFNKAQKLLCSEVGESVTIAGLLNQPSGWRGRADQIEQLRRKVFELQRKLPDSQNSRRGSTDGRSASNAEPFNRDRRRQIENLTKELKETETALENSKRKVNAARARIVVLENEVNSTRETISLLNQRNARNDRSVEDLRNRLKAFEDKFQERETSAMRQSERYEREIFLLKSEIESAQIHEKNFKLRIDEKVKELEDLRSKNAAMTDRKVLKKVQMNCPVDGPASSPKARDPSELIAIAKAAESERQRLLELIAVLSQRLDKERCDGEQLFEQLKEERKQSSKLKAKLQRLQLECTCQPGIRPGSYMLKSVEPPTTPDNEPSDPEETRLKLELLQEECLTLKSRLATVQKDKAADLVAFGKMLDETRKIFKDACRYKGNF